ncbi:hypothetical protein BGZ75_009510 [Mortierella antarctica]|nr:hypothetical protein BGZ75_009510 [Mortierella antarctica]
MLRPVKLLTGLLACCLFILTCILISAPSSQSNPYTHSSCAPAPYSSPPDLLPQLQPDLLADIPSHARIIPVKATRQVQGSLPQTSQVHSPPSHSTSATDGDSPGRSGSTVSTTATDEPRYLMYIPYAGVTNQLISIWHGSMIAKALNRTLLIPNLSPNVHVESEDQGQEPTATKWSEFFDLEHYSRMTGLKIEELDSFLARRGIVEGASTSAVAAGRAQMRKRSDERAAPGGAGGAGGAGGQQKKRLRKRWIQLELPIQQGHPISTPLSSSSSGDASSKAPLLTRNGKKSVKFPAVQQCFSEAGYGTDRRIDMTGRRFMQRYNIGSTLIPTPYLDPERDNSSIWARWRMDKVIERYLQPEHEQQEILCLGHVYRLLPGGQNRAWVEFGQHFHYTEQVHTFVDEILETLLPKPENDLQAGPLDNNNNDEENGLVNHVDPSTRTTPSPPPPRAFVGVHLRRGDFQRHCLGITSPADPNGWNRCYPSTEHIISLLDRYNPSRDQLAQLQEQQAILASDVHPHRPRHTHATAAALYKRQDPVQSTSDTKDQKLPVLVLTNERDPDELAKADAQNWIRVDHQRLGTLDRFGRYGPILIDGALLARARLLIGVEYSTYFQTASRRAETWYQGQAIFVT